MLKKKFIAIWDLPTRIFHWLLVILFFAAIISVKAGFIHAHATIGIILAGLIFFRILWGFWGSDTARFSFFIKGPAIIIRYLKGEHDYLGHNPLGGLMSFALIFLLALHIIFGLFSNDDILFEAPLAQFISAELSNQFTSWHYLLSKILIGLVAIHILAVLWYVFGKKQNLILEMITGNKYVSKIPVHLPLFVSLLRAFIFTIFSIILIIILFNV